MELHHVIDETAWQAALASGSVTPPEGEDFLHCCTPAQLDFVLARHFAGRHDIVVLTFEAEGLPGEIRWVRSEPDQDPFPHLYGAIACGLVRR